MDDVSLETRRELHWGALRALRRSLVFRAGLLAAAVAGIMLAPAGGPHWPLLVTAALLATAQAAWEYWRHARRDPDGPVANPDEDRASDRAEREAIKQRLGERRAPITMLLIVVLIAVAVAEVALARTTANAVSIAGLLKTPGAEVWRMLSATFLHANGLHLVYNIGALFMLGRLAEAYLPRWWMPVVYAAAALAGSAASLAFEARPSIGASGAIMGLAGCLFAASLGTGQPLPARVRLQIWILVALNFIIGAASAAYVDNAAHAGGFLAGAAIGWGFERLAHRRSGLLQRALLGCSAASAALLLIGAAGTGIVLARHRVAITPDVRLTTVSATLERHGSALAARLRNDSDRALEAYRLEVRIDGRIVETAWRDDCCFSSGAGQAPVPAHSETLVPLSPLYGRVSVTPPALSVSLALFDDGSYEGRGRELDVMREQRAQVVAETGFWMETLDSARERPAPSRAAWLAAVADQHAAGSAIRRPAAAALGIPALVDDLRAHPERADAAIADARRAIEASRRALLERIGGTPAPSGRQTP